MAFLSCTQTTTERNKRSKESKLVEICRQGERGCWDKDRSITKTWNVRTQWPWARNSLHWVFKSRAFQLLRAVIMLACSWCCSGCYCCQACACVSRLENDCGLQWWLDFTLVKWGRKRRRWKKRELRVCVCVCLCARIMPVLPYMRLSLLAWAAGHNEWDRLWIYCLIDNHYSQGSIPVS